MRLVFKLNLNSSVCNRAEGIIILSEMKASCIIFVAPYLQCASSHFRAPVNQEQSREIPPTLFALLVIRVDAGADFAKMIRGSGAPRTWLPLLKKLLAEAPKQSRLRQTRCEEFVISDVNIERQLAALENSLKIKVSISIVDHANIPTLEIAYVEPI